MSIDKLALIYIKNNCLLVARSKGRDVFYVPGGKREKGESDESTLMREIKEELTVDLNPNTIQYLHTFEEQAHGKPIGELVKMTCYQAEFTGEATASAEIDEIRWVNYENRSQCSHVTQVIMEWLKRNHYF